MATTGHEYTLVGFSEELDRRPLLFLDALPTAKVCSTCGCVPNCIAFLPCGHSFCKSCYEQCERSGQMTCPLEGDTSLDEEVTWVSPPTRSILAKQVRCWNYYNGCNVVTAASNVSVHFQKECGHHLTRCPKCGNKILSMEVCAHLEHHCVAREFSAAAVHPGTVSQEQESLRATCLEILNGGQGIHKVLSVAMFSIRDELKEIGRALKICIPTTTSHHERKRESNVEIKTIQESLSQLSVQVANLKDQFGEFVQNVWVNVQTFENRFADKNEAPKQSLSNTVQSNVDYSELADRFSAFKAEMKEGRNETKSELHRLALAVDRLSNQTSELLRRSDTSQETRMPNSEEVTNSSAQNLDQNASKIAWAARIHAKDRQSALALLPSGKPAGPTHTGTLVGFEFPGPEAGSGRPKVEMLQQVYLRGYCVSAGIGYRDEHEITLVFHLYKGRLDHYLEWPFNLQVRLSILHPQGGRTLECCLTPSRSSYFKDFLSRPMRSSNYRFCTHAMSLRTSYLVASGFIADDRMLLRLSLEDPSVEEKPTAD